ncbi:Calcium-dependent protein kinase [Actinidia chinensis var. chinensis]|uniref:non-specific serine/threonine protein kinase n=1 Tax=Actinidia chinensis var. chinensis TaxID=1590841 RepID=A0A2R6QNG0_ACTCC|nr:Calcium-dependent protein kinase [Actinidia chinensis var. chinensis]
MDIAKSDNCSDRPTRSCNSYRAPILTDTILDSAQTSNFKDGYILGEQLGLGQFGIIRACSDKLTGEVLACKSIAKERLVTPDDVRSVKLEIEIMTRLSGHPNVVDLKAVYEDEDYVHLVMELCVGGELFHQLEKHGRFSEYEARVLFRHLMKVVMYCHEKGIVHRDLKPENILLATKSFSSHIKLADFGLATYIKPGQTLHGTVGSPFYIAPEVLAGGYNQAADVWSAGVILYILLSGMPPFWGKTKSKIFNAVRAADLCYPPDLWDHISVSAKDLVTGMLCIDPTTRLTAKQVLAHCWLKDCPQETQEPNKNHSQSCEKLEIIGVSFSTPVIARSQDYSFTDGSPSSVESKGVKSPTFTCRSSFSSFLVDGGTPCSVSGGFSFSSCCESNTPDFQSPIPSMPSFTFFSPSSAVREGNDLSCFKAKTSTVDSSHRDSSMGKLFMLDASSSTKHQLLGETELRTDLRRGGGTSGPMFSGFHSKRNHTIGLGELDHFDLIVTTSVIRWASCTHVPSASSLRSSLVC